MLNHFFMSFKDNLRDELNYQGMIVKELAEKSGVPKGTIDHYLAEKNTEPIADNAVKIAQALGVSVEYLVTGNVSVKVRSADLNGFSSDDFKLLKKYALLLRKLDVLPEPVKNSFCVLVEKYGL